MGYEGLTFDVRDQVAVITLNRPAKLNALDAHLRRELPELCEQVEADDQLRALVITGAGRGFCSGVDLTAPAPETREPRSQSARLDDLGWTGRLALAVYGMSKPVIAAVNGVAAGAGMSLALACDIRFGSERTRFKSVFVERNLSPDTGLSYFLPRVVGYSRAADLLFSSRYVEADEAQRVGLLDHLVASETLIADTLAYAASIARWPPLAVRSTKRVLQQNLHSPLDRALRHELSGIQYAQRAPNDAREARASFLEKRAPKFTGT